MEQFVYIMRKRDPDTFVDLYKIGISIRPLSRARTCRADLIWLERGGARRERYLHRRFAHLRIRRDDFEGSTEWFLDEDDSIHEYLTQFEPEDDGFDALEEEAAA